MWNYVKVQANLPNLFFIEAYLQKNSTVPIFRAQSQKHNIHVRVQCNPINLSQLQLAYIGEWNSDNVQIKWSQKHWRYYGRKILIAFVTWSRQKGHLDTAEEHLRHNTWPQGTIVISTSELRQTRQIHAAFAVSASFVAFWTLSCTM